MTTLWLAYKGGSAFRYKLRNLDTEPAPTIGASGSIGGSMSKHWIFFAETETAALMIMRELLGENA